MPAQGAFFSAMPLNPAPPPPLYTLPPPPPPWPPQLLPPPSQPPTSEARREVLRELRRLSRDRSPARVWLPDEADAFVWRAHVRPARDSPLAADLASLGSDGGDGEHDAQAGTVLLELRFPPDFPTHPPFVRVLAPRFVMHTGHVTVGGSICTELLTSGGWHAGTNVDTLLEVIRVLLVQGSGRVDMRRANRPYGYAEARAAFERVARQHGWSP